jgi:glycosyltransferase involved in cell wall biosynthesis
MTGISVIVSTYNRPSFLERVLCGYASQTDRDFEVVVADDGSSQETFDLIARARREMNLRIAHVWHEHKGFRKSLIQNRAIVAAETDYLIFTDGDCIPRRDMIAVHRRLATSGRYVAGGYLKLSPQATASIQLSDIESGRFTDLDWLRSQGWKPGHRALRLTDKYWLSVLLDRTTTTAANFQGNNTGAWREHLYTVNGFENTMGYGGLDKALGYRMQNAGIKGIQARYRIIAMHLDHDRPYRSPEGMQKNRDIMKGIRKSGQVRAHRGIAELEVDPTLKVDRG